MDTSRESIAQAFRAAARVRRDQLFKADGGLPVSLSESAYTPYLGWVGRKYQGGTVLIAKNPGGGGDSQVAPTALDLEVQRRLLALRDDADGSTAALLEGVTLAFHAQLPSIGIGVLLARVLARLGETLDDVVFFNACPYRTRNDESLSTSTQKKSLELVAAPLVRALQPDTLIYLGVGVGREASKTLNARWTYVLPRAINDRQLKAEAVPVLDAIEADNAARSAYRNTHG
ncbi:hypothetical protein [Pseudacidovorax sp. RU35E]|uniref:hypothetical protein n=1 Tax=Pseudacidovorax sp. RU35E TaxID=1907403 RepID=UPI0009711CD4|nr:hypothetical protein [Pseudacidovorax sp. RU35E]